MWFGLCFFLMRATLWIVFLATAQTVISATINSSTNEFARYAGSESCQNCHREKYDVWRASNHGLAERLPSAELDQAAFVPARSFNQGIEHASARFDGAKVAAAPAARSGKTQACTSIAGQETSLSAGKANPTHPPGLSNFDSHSGQMPWVIFVLELDVMYFSI
jgi:hypothetical protein